MRLGLVDAALWASGVTTSFALLTVLLAKRRFTSEPLFCTWIALDCLSTPILFWIYRQHQNHLYFIVYWLVALLDLLLQVGLIAEFAWSIFHRNGVWVRRTPSRLMLFFSLALLSSIAVVLWTQPAAETAMDNLFARANLFMTMLFCTGFICLICVSRQLGVSWSTRSMRTAYGFSLWIIISFATDTLHTFWQFRTSFAALEHIRTITSQLVTIYWTTLQFRSSSADSAHARNMLTDIALLRAKLRGTPNAEVGS